MPTPMGGPSVGRRFRRSRDGRVPYSFAALVVGFALLLVVASLLTSEVGLTGGLQGQEPVLVDQAMQQAASMLEDNASNALLGILAHMLAGTDPDLSDLNASVASSVQSYVASSFRSSPTPSAQCPLGRPFGDVTVCVLSYAVDLTYPNWQTTTLLPQVPLVSPSLVSHWPAAPASELDPSRLAFLGGGNSTPFPAVVGNFTLVAVDPSGVTTQETFPFLRTETTPLGLLVSSSDLFTTDMTGPNGGFARLAQYILTTLAQLRALIGYGSGGYKGPDTGASTGVQEILTNADVADAGALAVALETFYAFHATDPSVVPSLFGNTLPSGFSALLSQALNGYVDGAALLLFLESAPPSDWSNELVALGESLAQSISSFSDRFTFDLLHTFWGATTVDPTLREPVADWNFVHSLSQQWALTELQTYMDDYRTWMGSQLLGLPSFTGRSSLPVLQAQADQAAALFGPGYLLCFDALGNPVPVPDTYTLFPGGTYSATTVAVPDLLSLVLGDPTAASPYPGSPFSVNTDVQITGSAPYVSALDFTLTDSSLLGEYAATSSTPAMDTMSSLLTDLSASMNAPAGSASGSPGYVPYVAAWMDGKLPSSITTSAAGLPDPTSAQQLGPSGSSSTYLGTGVDALYSGPFASSLSTFQSDAATQSGNWFVAGAEYPLGLGIGPAAGTPNSLLDIARLAVRLWTMMDYNLYWGGTRGISSNYIFGPVVYQAPKNEAISTPPTSSNGFPDFSQNLMVSLFTHVYQWIQQNTATGNPVQDCAWDSACLTNYGGLGPAACPSPWGPGSGYANAIAAYFSNPQGIWSALLPAALTVTSASVQQVGPLAQLPLLSAYADTKKNGPMWGPTFQTWVENYLGGPQVLPDTLSLAQSWEPDLYQSSESWTARNVDEHAIVDQPYLQAGVPYQFWQGNRSQAVASGSIYGTGPPQVSLALSSVVALRSQATETVQLVDPQDLSSNMGIAPFQTTWDVRYSATVSVVLTDPTSPLLPGPTGPEPTRLAFTLPLDAEFPVSVFTPWPLETGASGLPSDPVLTYTRGLTGIEGSDVRTASAPDYLPGTYLSGPLVDLLSRMGSVGHTAMQETAVDASLLGNLPGQGAEAGPDLSSALAESVDGSAQAFLGIAQQGNSAAARADMNTLSTALARIGFPPGLLYLNNYAFLGDNVTLTLQGNYAATWTQGSAAASVLDAQIAFSATSLSLVHVGYDNNYGPFNFGIAHSPLPGTSLGVGEYLTAGWSQWGVPSVLTLTSPVGTTPLPSPTSPATSLGSLYVPALGSTLTTAELYELGDPSLPSAAASAFQSSSASWLPGVGPGHPPTFDDLVSAEQYALADYFDSVRANGLSGSFTSLDLGVSAAEGDQWLSSSLSYRPAGPPTSASLMTFLGWAVMESRPLGYALGDPAPDAAVLSEMPRSLLSTTWWNASVGSCQGSVSTCPGVGDVYLNTPGGFTAANFAAIQCDLGGLGGGASDQPAVLFGGSGTSGTDPYLAELSY